MSRNNLDHRLGALGTFGPRNSVSMQSGNQSCDCGVGSEPIIRLSVPSDPSTSSALRSRDSSSCVEGSSRGWVGRLSSGSPLLCTSGAGVGAGGGGGCQPAKRSEIGIMMATNRRHRSSIQNASETHSNWFSTIHVWKLTNALSP